MTIVSTIYINDLNEKIKICELKKSLRAVFSQFGEIVDIIASKNLKMRGQAFVAFKDHLSANAALHNMQGFPFYSKYLKIQLAKTDSDVIAKLKGTYVDKPKKLFSKVEQNKDMKKSFNNVPVVPFSTSQTSMPNIISSYSAPLIKPEPQHDFELSPNNILFVTNLPQDGSEKVLTSLFERYFGFREVRVVPSTGYAFVEYENEEQAGTAKSILQGYSLTPTHRISVSFAKKGSLTSGVDNFCKRE